MSRLTGGIFSRPAGKTGGIVFGAARTRTGKVVTSRLLVSPSNPNTAAQQTQRGKFSQSLAITRLLGPSIYQSDWNRAIGQLPGFNSLFSTYLNSMDDTFDITTIPPVNLGSLNMSATFSAATGAGSGEITITFSTELGLNGTAADSLVVLSVARDAGATPLARVVTFDTSAVRSDGTVTVASGSPGNVITVLGYFRGVGTAIGLISPTKFSSAFSGT